MLKVSPNLVGRSLYAIIAIALLILASAAEELVFRGWLLKHSAAYIRNPVALMALNGLLFAAIHLDPNLDAFLVRAAMGAGLTWMALRLGGIELGIGAHAANNVVIVLLLRRSLCSRTPPARFRPERCQRRGDAGRLHRYRRALDALAASTALDRPFRPSPSVVSA